jgi:hypothetical protein
MNKEKYSFSMKIKINATNQTCPTDMLAIFMDGRKIGADEMVLLKGKG